ncbi:alpha/beta hydrolase family protein [Herpetosiphon llansteffanensis]
MLYNVGWRALAYHDQTRVDWRMGGDRPLLTHIWYPCDSLAPRIPMFIGPPDNPLFNVGETAPDAALAEGQFPLILISHGTGGLAMQLGWLARALAAQGYIVAGVNHHGNTGLEPYLVEGFTRVWERPRDLSTVLDRLLDDPSFGPAIDQTRIGAAGFSLGGYSVLALAGARLDLGTLLAAYTDSGRPLHLLAPPEFPNPDELIRQLEASAAASEHRQSYRDERVRAVFALAPALGEGFSAAGLAAVAIPVLIMAGAADTNTPPAANAQHYATLINDAELIIFEGAVGHYVFLAECTEAGCQLIPELCLDPAGVDRKAIQRQASEAALQFFARQLA